MKIIFINVIAEGGSTGFIVSKLHEFMLKKNDSFFIYGRGKLSNLPRSFKFGNDFISKIFSFISRIDGSQYNKYKKNTYEIIKKIEEIKPDLVNLHLLNGHFIDIYTFLDYLSSKNIRTVLTLHAEFMFTGSCGHSLNCNKWLNVPGCGSCPNLKEATNSLFFDFTRLSWIKMKNAFEKFKKENLIITTVSPWLTERVRISPILKKFKAITVENGINTKIFYYRENSDYVNKIIPEKDYILFVSSVVDFNKNHFKGAYFVLELASRNPDKIFVIVGGEKFNKNLPKNVIAIGKIANKDILAELYSNAKVTLVLSKKETFSLPIAESLTCGTPVVGFISGGGDSIAIKEYSSFVEYGNIDLLNISLNKYFYINFSKETISKSAFLKYNIGNMFQNYDSLFKQFQ